jgi:NADH-quinone oxidoreductase subunit H
VIFAVGLQLVPVVLLAERKLLGRFQGRYGPNRVGPYGALQPLADILKLLTKEQFRPSTSVGFLFALAPIISILTAVAAFAIIPFGNVQHIFGTSVGLYGIDVSIGPLYLFAFGAIAFYGIMLGGWSSGSKYSFLGAMRGAAQLISYEVSQGLALVGVIFTAQTLSLTGIVNAQKGMWYIVPQFFGFLIFLTASFAETNRAPFDLTEADAELVGGYNTEFGGGRFASYYFAEYLNVLVVSGIVTTVFLGGWLLPFGIHPPGWVDPFVVLVQDVADHVPVHLGPRDAAAPALRPADELRLEGPAAAGHAQRAGDGRARGGDALMSERARMPHRDPSCPTAGRGAGPPPALNVTSGAPART